MVFILALSLWLFSVEVFAQPSCVSMAKTALERAFCQVREKGGMRNISLKEFRANPAKTQQLLLKRPAKKFGIALPQIQAPKIKKTAKAQKNQLFPDDPAELDSAFDEELTGCSLHKSGSKIVCPVGLFTLLANQPNKNLLPSALTDANQLILPVFDAKNKSTDDVKRYVGMTYAKYISAMEVLGLGASTMSYTKYHLTFIETQRQKLEFAGRMFDMYELLKKEKSQMAISSYYTREMPLALKQCYSLNRERIVCDDVHNNWVYALEKR